MSNPGTPVLTEHSAFDTRNSSEGAVAAVEHAPVWVWGLPLAPLTRAEAVAAVERLIAARTPSYFITANLNYAMLTHRHVDLDRINRGAAFLLADGMPLVWASRWRETPLPERVAGSDLIYDLCALAGRRGFRVFLLGGAEGIAEQAARNLVARYPGLQLAGTLAPPFRGLSPEEQAELIAQVRAARPDLLLVAFGQPKGERWLAEHLEALGVPVGVQVGAALDFVAGKVARAPRWLQKIGLEWTYRLALEPARLGGRYASNFLFFFRMALRDGWAIARGRRPEP
jgi:N-acetylglucosaminyldiphosphoundecaprenol N-acetyl-beta-D-mannosaminyltransferase